MWVGQWTWADGSKAGDGHTYMHSSIPQYSTDTSLMPIENACVYVKYTYTCVHVKNFLYSHYFNIWISHCLDHFLTHGKHLLSV